MLYFIILDILFRKHINYIYITRYRCVINIEVMYYYYIHLIHIYLYIKQLFLEFYNLIMIQKRGFVKFFLQI